MEQDKYINILDELIGNLQEKNNRRAKNDKATRVPLLSQENGRFLRQEYSSQKHGANDQDCVVNERKSRNEVGKQHKMLRVGQES